MQKILIQGELGSFHHEAAIKLFGSDIEIIPCSSFTSVFAQIDNDILGLVAIENSLYGSINEVYDLLEKSDAKIIAETELSIHQNLITLPGAALADIREVYSHPVALAQCENYLANNLPHAEKVEFEDTAAAVRHITERNDPSLAAIASRAAAELYNTQILAPQIEDNPVNFTRFVALSKAPERHRALVQQPQAGKSSITLITGHQPGALYEALGVFVSHQVNLTKLQSRPIIGEKWHYRFYLDFEASEDETELVISDLKSLDNNVVFLGNY
ncbi:MAG TPA: prephenate dehydratase domain-containing protein [Candidatus Nanoperiomorbaceae bacterium]|nr:prephenate dehydratase domain-containing protein [Candidatus Nanoperiomorbaceae bacterium]HMR86191.1 prephenate dehydratase domain-containing protein [Candidatus Nanoperiomorbaceae bacterium]HMU11937.1 prephenate dehydratase domain-containing protein [Candidatus Nanoperiomorbaceae bacterium]